MAEDDLETMRRELAEARAERDALQRELGDLRARLCIKLGIVRREEPDEAPSTVLSVASDAEIVQEVQRLRDDLARLVDTERSDGLRWSGIDDLITGNRKIHAVQTIRARFGASLPLAVDLLSERYTQLRHRYPERFSESPEAYWDGFTS
ncbi:hypothetical protein [Kitasatospora sp. NPDC004289]